jgi:hypothetical protein
MSINKDIIFGASVLFSLGFSLGYKVSEINLINKFIDYCKKK